MNHLRYNLSRKLMRMSQKAFQSFQDNFIHWLFELLQNILYFKSVVFIDLFICKQDVASEPA